MVGYAVFIKDHLEKQPSVCDIDEIAEWLHVVTNHGLIKPRDRPVHFTVTYGNKIDLNKHLPGETGYKEGVCVGKGGSIKDTNIYPYMSTRAYMSIPYPQGPS